MPHADIFHLHVPTKKSVFDEKPEYVKIKDSSLYKFWDHKVKVPKKVCSFFLNLVSAVLLSVCTCYSN